MTQLTEPAITPGNALIRLDEAQARIVSTHEIAAGIEGAGLSEAIGRVLAHDMVAPIDLPGADNSAVDGYAVRFDDLLTSESTLLPLHGRTAAGLAPEDALPEGCAGRIFTGAVLPSGADTVLMQEDCELVDGGVRLPPGIRQGDNRRKAGEDICSGALALAGGRRLTPPDLALLAALGFDRIALRKRLRVAIFSTGNEVTTPQASLRRGQVYDANRFLLRGLLQRLLVDVTDGGILPDNPEATRKALRNAADNVDLVITSGGVSSGEEDHVRAAIEAIGKLDFWRVAIKPGRPVALGLLDHTPLLGLPGNPVAALVTFWAIGRPLLDRLAGAAATPTLRLPVRSGFHHSKKPGLREYLRVQIAPDGTARCYPKKGTGILTSLTGSDALMELAEDMTSLAPGDLAPCIPLRCLYG